MAASRNRQGGASKVAFAAQDSHINAASRLRLVCWLCLALLWFVPLGEQPLLHPDEGRYSEISREMLLGRDWVTPRLNDLKYFEKPPLQYWATAISLWAFGLDEFGARFFTASCGFLTVVSVWLCAKCLWGRKAADYAAITTGSMAGLVTMSHVVTLDAALSLFLTVALCAFLVARHRAASAGRHKGWLRVMWVAIALATLTKGPIGCVLPAGALAAYSLMRNDWRVWQRMEWMSGILIFLLLTGPWVVLVSLRNPEFFDFFFIHEHAVRYFTTEHDRAGAVWYFVPIVLCGLMPWTTLTFEVVRRNWVGGKIEAIVLAWCAFIFLFFTLSGSKLPPYVLPILPALGLLLGPYLARAPPDILLRHARYSALCWAALGAGGYVVLRFLPFENTPLEVRHAFAPWALAAGGAAAVLSGVSSWATRAHSSLSAAVLLALGSLAALQLINTGYRHFAPLKSAQLIAKVAAPHISPGTELYVIRRYDQTLPFYLNRTLTMVAATGELALGQRSEPEKFIPTVDAFRERWLRAPDAVAFTSPEMLAELLEGGLPMTVIAVHYRHAAFRKP